MSTIRSAAIWTGGIALLVATFADTIAVIGRHIGVPFHGSIELIQAAVLVAGSIALVIATVEANHARVRLIVDRLRGRPREWVSRLSDLFTALVFAAMLAGCAWIAADLWSGHEVSEVLGVPWRAMRLFANVALAAGAIVAFLRAVRGAKR